MKLNPAKCSFGVSSGKFLGYIVIHRGIEANPKQIRAIHSIPSRKNVKEVQKLTGRMAAVSRFISRLSDKSHAFFGTLKNLKDFYNLRTRRKRRPRSRGGKQAATNLLLSKALLDVETRYSHLETLALALIVAALGPLQTRSLRTPRQIGRGTRGVRRNISTHYGYKVTGPSGLRGSILPCLAPALEQEVRLRGVTKEEGEWILHIDGSSNVRGAGVGIVLTSPTGDTASRAVRCNFKATNNESEYETLITGLTLAHQMGAENIQVFGDSTLIINQVQEEYQAKDDSMIQYLAVAQRLIKKFKSCKLTQIPREQNSQADALANLGSALRTNRQMSIPLLMLQWPATLEEPPSEEVSAVEEGKTWMTPLVQYLEANIQPEDRNEARKIKKPAAREIFTKNLAVKSSTNLG
ncbi:uncharacterized protein LOC125583114 [Brassica napus]|uniref:uncharacterized protein LOC125583114 n=1 Tax=Brassica napus TaxID=3708 RepID=UPI00207A13C9|nr:uncharacterized protein LOC125583114 [Brassica napus]